MQMYNQERVMSWDCPYLGGNGTGMELSTGGLGILAPCLFLRFRSLLVFLKRKCQGHVMERKLPVATGSQTPATHTEDLNSH